MDAAYALTRRRRAVNAFVRLLARLGLAGADTYVLTVPGRRTGRPRSTPVRLVERDGERWLVAPYGESAWVRNVRASGTARLTRAGRTEVVDLVEAPPERSAPVLRAYVRAVPIVRPFFDAPPDAPLEAFISEARRHPVFRVGPAANAGATPAGRTRTVRRGT